MDKAVIVIALSIAMLCVSIIDSRAMGKRQGVQSEVVIEPLTDGLYAYRTDKIRSFFMIGNEGVLVVDPISKGVANIVRDEIAKLTDKPVTQVVYSHSLNQRSSGGKLFKDQGARFIAQERCDANFRELANPDVVLPDEVFSSEYTVSLGNRSLDLYYLGLHYDCSIVMITRPDNIMFVVGTVSPPGPAVPTNPSTSNVFTYNLVPFLSALETLAKQEGVETMIADEVVFQELSNGVSTLTNPTGPASSIAGQKEFWETFFEAVTTAKNNGVTGSLIGRTIDHTPYENMRGYDKRNVIWIARRVNTVLWTGK